VRRNRRFRICGDFTVRDAEGFVREFHAGDELPADIQELLSDREIAARIGHGGLMEVGAKPTPRREPPPPEPPTAEEMLEAAGWGNATVKNGRVEGGPRAADIKVLDRPPSAKDIGSVAGHAGSLGAWPALAHQADDGWVAVVPLARLLVLLAMIPEPRR
jgi:hypothetical protein